MKALIFSVMALALSIQAEASCSARDNSTLLNTPSYNNQLPNRYAARTQKPTVVRSQHSTATVRGRR